MVELASIPARYRVMGALGVFPQGATQTGGKSRFLSAVSVMRPEVEPLHLLPKESFRLVRWNEHNVTAVEVIGIDGKAYPYKGAGAVWHCHPGMELVLVTQGTGTRLVGDSIEAFRAVDAVLLGDNLPHLWHTTGPMSGYALQWGFGPDDALRRLPEANELGAIWRDAQRGIWFTGPLAMEIAGLVQSMPGQGGIGRVALLLTIFDKLQRAPPAAARLLSQISFSPSGDPSKYRGIQRAVALISNSFREELTLADVVRKSCMSVATFERQFKRHTGKTFTRFLTEVRIAAVRRLLLETDLPVAQIAFACGFNNLSHFNHQFRLIHGEAPGDFRRRARRRL